MDAETAENISEARNDSKGAIIGSIIGIGGGSFILSESTPSFVDKLTINTSLLVSMIIFVMLLILVFFFRFFIREKCKNKIEHMISLKTIKDYQIKLKPKPSTYMVLFPIICLFMCVCGIGSIAVFFIHGNIFMLLLGTVIIFLLFLINNQVIRPGKAEVEFVE